MITQQIAQEYLADFAIGLGQRVEYDEAAETFSMGNVMLSLPNTSENGTDKFDVLVCTVIPGVWRTSNGDGWPDEVDVNSVGLFDSFDEAVTKIGELLVERAMNVAAENRMWASSEEVENASS